MILRVVFSFTTDQQSCTLFELLVLKQAPRSESIKENYFSYLPTKTYVVGTQKNRLDETVLLSTQNACLN